MKEAEQRLAHMKERVHVTDMVCNSKGFPALCAKLNELLATRSNHLQVWLQPVIPPVLWKDWQGSVEIARALDYLQKAHGKNGLKYFHDVLAQMGEEESLSVIQRSSCADMFSSLKK
jgi:hypothetical protein